ncbi:MAG: CAP domain-containing protein [Candidatus Latescibacteria bacterium]|nr:CAP domain-containing protein [Candidatus Latescibacterota bacterium]
MWIAAFLLLQTILVQRSEPIRTAFFSPAPLTRQASAERPGIAHLEDVENLILTLTNDVRRQHGLPALLPEETLRLIARGHSDDMLTRRFFAHVNPDGQNAADRIALQHRRLIGVTGENIWSGSGYVITNRRQLAETIIDGWMQSPGHRENILRREYTHLGVGVSVRNCEIRATQNFAAVRAYVNWAIPQKVGKGGLLNLSITSFPASEASAERYDYWLSKREQQAGDSIPIMDGTVNVDPGMYTLRFYFPRPGGFTIYWGPAVEVR